MNSHCHTCHPLIGFAFLAGLLLAGCAGVPTNSEQDAAEQAQTNDNVVTRKAGEKTDRQAQRVEGKVDQKVDEKTDEAVDSVLDKAFEKIFR